VPTIAFLGGKLGGASPEVHTLTLAPTGAYDVPLPPGYSDTLALQAAGAQADSTAATPEPTLFANHPVAEGETLSGIAEQHGLSVDYLIWNNPEAASDPNLLLIGEELLIPASPGIVYDVRLGDTIYDIAARYSIDPNAVIEYAPNKLNTPDVILEGAVLLLPGAVPPAPVVTPEAAIPEEPAPAAAPAAVVRQPSAVVSTGLIWPVAGTLWGGFGPRWGSFHKGIDIGAPYGTAVTAAGGGQVVLATSGGGYGNYIVVRHGDGVETLYAHLSAIYVSLGQYVGQGEVIGAVGCTGWCTGNHLHFEVHVGGYPVNPLIYLP
jgi:murein DD-endopeptidase MepM/ murein hydrolase activator NlpD